MKTFKKHDHVSNNLQIGFKVNQSNRCCWSGFESRLCLVAKISGVDKDQHPEISFKWGKLSS